MSPDKSGPPGRRNDIGGPKPANAKESYHTHPHTTRHHPGGLLSILPAQEWHAWWSR